MIGHGLGSRRRCGEKQNRLAPAVGVHHGPEEFGRESAAGFDGFLTLEPHLNVAASGYGRTSPARFKVAADALKQVLAGLGGGSP